MKKSCLYFDKKYKCVSFIVHYIGLSLSLIVISQPKMSVKIGNDTHFFKKKNIFHHNLTN